MRIIRYQLVASPDDSGIVYVIEGDNDTATPAIRIEFISILDAFGSEISPMELFSFTSVENTKTLTEEESSAFKYCQENISKILSGKDSKVEVRGFTISSNFDARLWLECSRDIFISFGFPFRGISAINLTLCIDEDGKDVRRYQVDWREFEVTVDEPCGRRKLVFIRKNAPIIQVEDYN